MARGQAFVRTARPWTELGPRHTWTCSRSATLRRTGWLPAMPSAHAATVVAPAGPSCATMGSVPCCMLAWPAQPASAPCSNPSCGWTGSETAAVWPYSIAGHSEVLELSALCSWTGNESRMGPSCATTGSVPCCMPAWPAQPALGPCSNPSCGWTGRDSPGNVALHHC